MQVEAPPRQRRLSFSEQVHRFLSVNNKDDRTKRDRSPTTPARASTEVQSRPVSWSDPAKAGKNRRLSLSRSPFSSRKENDDLQLEPETAKAQHSELEKEQNQQTTPAENDPNWPLGPPAQNGEESEKPAEAARPSQNSDICVSPTWDYAEQRKKQRKEKKRMERDQKQLEKDQKQFAKRLKQLEEAQERREGRSSSRRLIKKQPLGNSSRASSANAATSRESSAGPIFHRRAGSSRASRSSSSQRPGSNHGNEPAVDSIETTLASDNAKGDSSMPPLSANWPERFGPTISKELAFSYRRTFAGYQPEEPSRRSLHATAKYADLRRTAQSSPVAGESSTSANLSSPDRRPLSSDSAKSQINGPEHSVSKAETPGTSKDIEHSSTATLSTKERNPKTESKIHRRTISKAQRSPNASKASQSAANAGVSRGGADKRPTTSQGPTNSVESEHINTQKSDRPASVLFFGTSTRSAEKEQQKAPAPTSAANTSRHRKPGSSTLVVTNPDQPDAEPLEEPKIVPPQPNGESQSAPKNALAETSPTDESQQSRPGFARRLSLRLGLGDKKTVEARRRSDVTPSSSSQNVRVIDRPIPLLSKEAVLADVYNSRSSPRAEPENASARPVSFLHPSSALSLGRSDRTGQLSRTTSDTTSQRSVHSTQYESISEVEEEKANSPTPNGSSNNLPKQLSRRSSLDSVSDGYNTAHENFSTTESLGRASPAITPEHFPSVPSVPTQNKSNDHVASIITPTNPSSSSPKEPPNAAPSPATGIITTNGTSSSSSSSKNSKKTTTALQQSAKPLAKIFVICCHCKFWHDIPSKIYATLALPDHNNTNANSNGNRPSSPRTSSTSPLVPLNQRSNSSSRSVKCCWCNHSMNKSCCEGWTTIVYKHERLH
ncbi:hypothetical protein Plec18167_004382 [Paecilomyces lecythidis]|uniref:Uncharacterized protein n=1 Tax=Paecilomyces lecythidis TaxID=3004212 RepID=A0ABR3XRF6_9EURO